MLPACRKRAAGEDSRPRWEVADIFRHYGEAYRHSHALPRSHPKVMQAIEVCRTAYLGGHIEQCDCCGFQRQAYNSCRNRHCPKCQSLAKAQWLQQQKAELLPVGYFHLVFTLPHELNLLALRNKRVVCNLLFRAVAETLLDFSRTHLGGTLGLIAVLHTWDQTLRDHFHLHCLIPGGALSLDGSHWIRARSNFLFPVKALRSVFRGKFLHLLDQAFSRGQLQFSGQTASLTDPDTFARLLLSLRRKKWIVYAKKPFSSPERVLDYLGRYTHRVALSNHRIVSVQDDQVTFLYRDRKNGDQLNSMTLPANEFIRRFLLHVLPQGFMRIRHFGFLANRSKKHNLARCRQLLGLPPPLPQADDKTTGQQLLELTGIDWFQCPCCKQGTMIVIAPLPNPSSSPFPLCPMPQHLDSS